MYKKIFTVILMVNYITTQCESTKNHNFFTPSDKNKHIILVQQIKAAEQTLQNIYRQPTKAQIGGNLASWGLTGAIATLWLSNSSNEIFAICGLTTAGGLLIAWTGGNEAGNAEERKMLIRIIENASKELNEINK